MGIRAVGDVHVAELRPPLDGSRGLLPHRLADRGEAGPASGRRRHGHRHGRSGVRLLRGPGGPREPRRRGVERRREHVEEEPARGRSGPRQAMVRRGQRRDLRRRRQHDLPDGPRARGRHPGLQLARVDGIFGSDRRPRLLDRVGQALRGAGIDLRTDQVRPRLAQPVPAVHRRRPCDPGHGPREPRTADGTPLQPTRRADQSGRVRRRSLRERRGRPRGECLRGLGRRERPQRVRERILRRRPHLDRAVAGERGPREHERLAVDRRRGGGDRRPRLVRHRRPRGPGLLPVVVLGPHRRDGRPVGRVPGPGPAQLHGSGKLPDLPGPRDGAPDALRADLPGRARLHDEQRGPEHGGLLLGHRRLERRRPDRLR